MAHLPCQPVGGGLGGQGHAALQLSCDLQIACDRHAALSSACGTARAQMRSLFAVHAKLLVFLTRMLPAQHTEPQKGRGG